MVSLGQTTDPADLVPGDPGAIATTVIQLYDYGVLLAEAGNGLSRIGTSAGWSGAAADAFRQRFSGQPRKWQEAGSCFMAAAKALDDYIPVLVWAQNTAGVAIQMWAEGDKKNAEVTLDRAQGQVQAAADTANAAVAAAAGKAPAAPGFWSDVGHFFSSAGHDITTGAEDAVDALASLGNAVIQNPGADLGLLGGTLLAAASAGGFAIGVAADGTIVLAPAGVALDAVSAAGVVAGTGLALASAADLGGHAAGDDRVDPLNSDAGTPQQTAHGAERAADPSRLDPAAQSGVIANPTETYTQPDGAQVYVQQVGDRYNVVVQGENGVVTNLKSISENSLSRLARNYGWTKN